VLRDIDGQLVQVGPKQVIQLEPTRQPPPRPAPTLIRLTLLVRWPADDVDRRPQDRRRAQADHADTTIRKVKEDGKEKDVIVSTDVVTDVDIADWVAHLDVAGNQVKGFDIAAIDRPGDLPRRAPVDPFERFKPEDPKAWVSAFMPTDEHGKEISTASSRAFRAFRGHVTASAPKLSVATEPCRFRRVRLASYPRLGTAHFSTTALDLKETSRYGTRSADRRSTSLRRSRRRIKATPWRLSAAADGTQSISFLHSDRWGHARAYALKPYGRYQELAHRRRRPTPTARRWAGTPRRR